MQSRSKETRFRLLDAANELFSRSGYEATSVAEICQAAGVSKGAFYHHFPSKQAVFQELLEIWLARLDAAFQTAIQEQPDVPMAMTTMAVQAAQILRSPDIRLSIFLEFWHQAYLDPSIWQKAVEPYRHYQRFFSLLVQRGIEMDSIQSVNPDVAARLIVSVALGLLLQALFDPSGADWSVEAVRSVDLLVNLLSNKKV